MGEKGKIAVRNIRREANEELKKKLKDKVISEDQNKNFEKNIQKITDNSIDNIDKILIDKEKRLAKYEQTQPYCLYNGWQWKVGYQNKRGRNFGHLKGVETVKKKVTYSLKLNIPIDTFYVFSSENRKRPKKEISFLFKLIKRYFTDEIDQVVSEGIKINIIGDIKKLSPDLNKILKNSVQLTKKIKKIIVNLAINYGSKHEILIAFKLMKKNISIKKFEKNLYTSNMPDPDILIRTGGQKRLSNFMLWQLAYSELFFLDKLWPDFKSSDLKNNQKFNKIKRNFELYSDIKFKKRIYTSFILFFLVFLIFKFNIILVYSLLILGVFSILEFINISRKIFKKNL